MPLKPVTQIQNHNLPLEPLIRGASNELSSLGGFSTILDKQPVSNWRFLVELMDVNMQATCYNMHEQ